MALSQLSVTKQQRSRGSVVTPIISTFQLKKEGGGGGLSFVSQCGASSRCAASSFPRSAVSAVVPAADQLILPHTGRRAGGGSCAGTCDHRRHEICGHGDQPRCREHRVDMLHNAFRNFSTAYILDSDNRKYFQHHKHNLVIFIIFNCLHIHTATHIMSRPDSSALSRIL